ncbi:hypothetical protein LBMAG01_02260 [Acidobacteriota bacterium]|nr:hypothetical protein LBMAG01_02260 [Acidobacteriota bacterium]
MTGIDLVNFPKPRKYYGDKKKDPFPFDNFSYKLKRAEASDVNQAIAKD